MCVQHMIAYAVTASYPDHKSSTTLAFCVIFRLYDERDSKPNGSAYIGIDDIFRFHCRAMMYPFEACQLADTSTG